MELALSLADFGMHVFPVTHGEDNTKKPLTKNGHLDSTQDPGVIQDWWEKWPSAKVGVATGASGLNVADVDIKNGHDGFESIAEAWKDLPDTFSYETGTGGYHFIYAAPKGLELNGVANYRGMDGVDRRAGSSWVLWVGGVPSSWGEIVPAPEWLNDEVQVRQVHEFEGTLKDWYENLLPGEPNALTRKAIERATERFEKLNRDFSHSDIVEMQYEAVRLGSEGNAGVPQLLDHIEDLFLSREGEHSRSEQDWGHEWQEALQSAIEKFGDAIEKLKNLPEYNLSIVPKNISDTLVTQKTDKTGYSKLLGELIRNTDDDDRIASILWNCPATTDIARDWGLEFTYTRIQEARVKPEPTRENPRIEEQREQATVTPEFTSTELLSKDECEYIAKRPTFVDHFVEMAKGFDYDQFAYFRAAGWSVLSMAMSFQGFVPEGGAGKHSLNFWNIIIGDSGTGKTLVQQIRDMAMRKLFEHERGDGVPYYDLGSDSSPQGLLAALLERDNRPSILSGDEAADFFLSIKNQKNNASFPETLTKWSNGDVAPVNKVTMKDELKGKAAKTAFSMQFFSTRKNLIAALDRGMFEKGFLARVTWTLGNPKPQTDDIYDLSQPEEDVTMDSMPPEVESLVTDLMAARAMGGYKNTALKATPEALKRMGAAYLKMDKTAQLRPNYELTGPSVIRLKDTMLKCAGMCALYRGDTQITMQDALHAIRAVEEWFTNLFIVADWVSEGDFQRTCAEMESWVRDQPGGKATATRIKYRFKNKIQRDPRELDNYLTSLVETGILNRNDESGTVTYELNGA